MKLKTAILTIAVAMLSVGCANTNDVVVPYTGGDVCEWAKKNLVVATHQFQIHQQDSFTTLYTRRNVIENLSAAQANVAISCKNSEDDGTWACAEGHSCK